MRKESSSLIPAVRFPLRAPLFPPPLPADYAVFLGGSVLPPSEAAFFKEDEREKFPSMLLRPAL